MESFWESFRLDPRVPENAAMRASDADREIVRLLLGEAYADGRLLREEYDDRLTTLLDSRTLGELPPLVVDLVSPTQGAPPAAPATPANPPTPEQLRQLELRNRAAAAYRREVQDAVSRFLVPSLICVVIWLLASHGDGFFWPVFVMLATGVRVVQTVVRRESIIDREVSRLESRRKGPPPPPPPAGGRS